MKGWIYLHRDVMNHWIWRNPRHFQWWVLLLLLAEWSPAKLQFGNTVVKVKRGEMATTTRVLAKLMNSTSKTVLSFLSILEQNEMIILSKKQRFTHIKIVNYERYQTVPKDTLQEQKVKRTLQQIKENNKYINNNHTTRAREEELIDEVKKSENFIEECANSLDCGVDESRSLFERFVKDTLLTDKVHTDVSDFKRHFLNWAKISKEKYGRKQQQEKAGGSDRYEVRRGTGVSAKKADDFNESF